SVSTATEIQKTFGTFAQTNGIEYLMDTVYNLAGATNGYDQYGHFLRGNVLITGCPDYRGTPLSGCIANWGGRTSTAAQAPLSRYIATPPPGARLLTKPPTDLEGLPEIDPTDPAGDDGEPGTDSPTDPSTDEGESGQPGGSSDQAGERDLTPRERESVKRSRAAMARAEILLRYLLGVSG
ncbi:MAG: hypothetical protein ACKOPI_06265, partial [bacterium]